MVTRWTCAGLVNASHLIPYHYRLKRKIIRLISFLLLTNLAGTYAQSISQKLFLTSSVAPAIGFSDTTGQYSSRDLAIGFSVPVFGKIDTPNADGVPSFTAILLNGEFEASELDLGPFDDHRLISRPWVDASLIYYGGEKSVLISSIQMRWMEDEFSVSRPKLRPTALLAWRLQATGSFSYLLGATYTYNFGTGLPFPVLGLQKKFSERLNVNVVLPLSIIYQGTFKSQLKYHLFLKPAGRIARFGNNDVFSEVTDENLLLRERAVKLGGRIIFSLHVFKFIPETGVLGARQLSFSDLDDNVFSREDIYNSGIDPAPYFKLSIQTNLGGKKKSTNPMDTMGNEWVLI